MKKIDPFSNTSSCKLWSWWTVAEIAPQPAGPHLSYMLVTGESSKNVSNLRDPDLILCEGYLGIVSDFLFWNNLQNKTWDLIQVLPIVPIIQFEAKPSIPGWCFTLGCY